MLNRNRVYLSRVDRRRLNDLKKTYGTLRLWHLYCVVYGENLPTFYGALSVQVDELVRELPDGVARRAMDAIDQCFPGTEPGPIVPTGTRQAVAA